MGGQQSQKKKWSVFVYKNFTRYIEEGIKKFDKERENAP